MCRGNTYNTARRPCPICGQEGGDNSPHILGEHTAKCEKDEANLAVEHVHPTGGIVSRQHYFSPETGENLETVRRNLRVSKKANVRIVARAK